MFANAKDKLNGVQHAIMRSYGEDQAAPWAHDTSG